MDAIKDFLRGYWDFMRWYLIALAGVYLVTWLVFGRPGKAFGILLLGFYVTATVYFLTVRESMGFGLETSLGVVIAFGLTIGVGFYYFVFVRTA